MPVYCTLVNYKSVFNAPNRTTPGRVLALLPSSLMVKCMLSLYFDAKAMVMGLVDGAGPAFYLLRSVRLGFLAQISIFVHKLGRFINSTELASLLYYLEHCTIGR